MLDKQNEFSDSQAVTVTAISTNVIDTMAGFGPGVTSATTSNLGGPEAIYLVIEVDTTFTAGGAATLIASLESDSTANLATSPTVHFTTAAIPVASLTAKSKVAVVGLPFGAYEKYLGVRYTVGTGPMTAGAISAYLTRDPSFWVAYNAAGNPG